MSKSILVGYDPEHHDEAPVRFGVAASRFTGAPLHIASVHSGPAVAGQANDLERRLGELGAKAELRSLEGGSAPAALHQAAEEMDAGLLVVGSRHHGHGGIVHPGSTAERLLQGAPCPIAVVPPEWQMGGGLNVLGAAFVDTDEGRDALRGATALARHSGATLRVLAAVHSKHYGREAGHGAGSEVSTYDLVGDREKSARIAALEVIGDTHDLDLDLDVSAQEAQDFLIAASERVDLLICGSRGYGPRRAVLLGGVTRRVIREARCPVIVLTRGTEETLEALIGSPEPAVA